MSVFPPCFKSVFPPCFMSLFPPCFMSFFPPCFMSFFPPCFMSLFPPCFMSLFPPCFMSVFPPCFMSLFPPCFMSLFPPCFMSLFPPCFMSLFPPKDTCSEVRVRFSLKLHKGLARGIPHKCLPLDFMGFYAFAGLEKDKQLRNAIKQYMVTDINKRREYIKSITMSGGGKSSFSALFSCSSFLRFDHGPLNSVI